MGSEREAPERILETYDAGLFGDGGGGNVEWWHDYLRYELGRAHEHYAMQYDALLAEREEARERAEALTQTLDGLGEPLKLANRAAELEDTVATLLAENAALRELVERATRPDPVMVSQALSSHAARARLGEMGTALAREVLRLREEVERLRLSGRGNANIVGQLRAYIRSVEEWGRERREGGPEERAKSKAMDATWNGLLRTLAAHDAARDGAGEE